MFTMNLVQFVLSVLGVPRSLDSWDEYHPGTHRYQPTWRSTLSDLGFEVTMQSFEYISFRSFQFLGHRPSEWKTAWAVVLSERVDGTAWEVEIRHGDTTVSCWIPVIHGTTVDPMAAHVLGTLLEQAQL